MAGDLPPAPSEDFPTNQLHGAAALERYKAELNALADQTAADARDTYENVYRERWWAIDDQFYTAIFGSLTGSVERARSAAETVQKASAAIATLYGAGIGVSFSVSDGPLPVRGVIPLVFLGLAVVCSTAYLAWIPDRRSHIDSLRPEAENLPVVRQRAYADEYTTYVWRQVTRHASMMRASVVALAFGLAFVPAPFVEISTGAAPAEVAANEPPPATQIELTDWPGSALVTGLDPEVGAALMAEVASETAGLRAKQRAAAAPSEPPLRISWMPSWGWLLLTVIGLAIVGLTALIRRDGGAPAAVGGGPPTQLAAASGDAEQG